MRRIIPQGAWQLHSGARHAVLGMNLHSLAYCVCVCVCVCVYVCVCMCMCVQRELSIECPEFVSCVSHAFASLIRVFPHDDTLH